MSEKTQKTKVKAPQVDLFTRQQVADLLSVNLATLFIWNKKGILPAWKIGGRVYYKKADIEASLKQAVNPDD